MNLSLSLLPISLDINPLLSLPLDMNLPPSLPPIPLDMNPSFPLPSHAIGYEPRLPPLHPTGYQPPPPTLVDMRYCLLYSELGNSVQCILDVDPLIDSSDFIFNKQILT